MRSRWSGPATPGESNVPPLGEPEQGLVHYVPQDRKAQNQPQYRGGHPRAERTLLGKERYGR